MATAYGKVGVEGAASTVVEQTNTAKTMKSGSLDVFSTPSMVALMEEAACNALRVPDGFSSVGIAMSIKHLAATSLGRSVKATAWITNAEKNIVEFSVVAKDSTGTVIGEGTHRRAVVGVQKFMEKAIAKAEIGSL